MADKAWKKLERKIGKLLGGERVKRMGDFSVSATDVILYDLPHIKIDCKLRRNFPHHSLYRGLKKRKGTGHPVLVTEGGGVQLVNIEAEFFAKLLRGPRPKPIRLMQDHRVKARYSHHSLYNEIIDRYCRNPGEEPVLITKEHNKKIYLVTISTDYFARLRSGQASALGALAMRSRTASAGGLDS